jgi:hypothetical protein
MAKQPLRFKLSDNPRNRYSPAELSLFEELASSKHNLNLQSLALGHYAPGPLPFNWQPIVRVTLNQLMKKMELNKEPVRIEKIKTHGERELKYQLIRRK